MAKKTKEQDQSIAAEMLAGLQDFARDLKRLNAKESKAKYRHRTVQVDWEPHEYAAEDVVAIRKAMECSQQVFADFIGVAPGTLRNWEQGVRPASGIASRLFDEMRINPGYWKLRLQQSTSIRQAS